MRRWIWWFQCFSFAPDSALFSSDPVWSLSEGPKPATRGGWMGAVQNFFEIRIVGLCPKIAQALKRSDQIWSSYWKANPTQKVSNQRTKTWSESEAKWENFRTDLPGPVWPVHRTGLTGLGCSKTSRPVWPVLPTGLTGGTQKTPENLDSNDESQPNDHENRWNLGDSFAPTPWTYPQEISS